MSKQNPEQENSERLPDDLPPEGPEQSGRETLERAQSNDPGLQKVHAQLMREKGEPTEGFTPIPLFLMTLFGLLFFWAGLYLQRYSGDFRPDVFDTAWQPGGGETVDPTDWETDTEALFARGQRIFSAQCAQCHQADGQGVSGQYPPLVDSTWVTGNADKVTSILLNGLAGPIEVRGNIYNGNMPAFAGTLSSRDIAGVLTYVRNEWGNNAAFVRPSDVDRMREDSTTQRTLPWSADDLKELYPDSF